MAGIGVAALTALLSLGGCSDRETTVDTAAPDIELSWEGRAGDLEPVRGAPGDRVFLGFRLRNSGTGAAYRATVHVTTALGPAQEPLHFVPGPAPGRQLYGAADFELAEGQAKLPRGAPGPAHPGRGARNGARQQQNLSADPDSAARYFGWTTHQQRRIP